MTVSRTLCFLAMVLVLMSHAKQNGYLKKLKSNAKKEKDGKKRDKNQVDPVSSSKDKNELNNSKLKHDKPEEFLLTKDKIDDIEKNRSIEKKGSAGLNFGDMKMNLIPKFIAEGHIKDGHILQSVKKAVKEKVSKLEKKNRRQDSRQEDDVNEREQIGISSINLTCATAKLSHQKGSMENHFMMSRSSDHAHFVKCEFVSRNQRASRKCLITRELQCDGVSACLTDECGCSPDTPVFYCSDGNGCVSLGQVCDGQADCLDASDECVCDSYLNCEVDRNNEFCKQGERRAERCGLTNDLQSRKRGTETTLPGLFQCAADSILEIDKRFSRIMEAQDYSGLCKRQCKQLENHCERVDWESLSVDKASRQVAVNYTCATDSSIALSPEVDVCDGFHDCPNRAEEFSCANRFYCDDAMKSIPLSKVCDSVPDCHDLSDECQECARNNLADDKLMISNKYISYYMVILCVFIFILNLRGLYGHGAKLYFENQRFASKLNSVLCVQLCIYDSLMGLYVLIITSKNFQFYGSYCLHDAAWRSSHMCNVTGVLFTLSSHGSLVTALMMGVYRCYTCEHLLVYFPPRKCVACLAVANILVVLSSVVTLLPIQLFEDTFVTAVSFEGNPIVTKGTRQLIDGLIMEYYGMELDPDTFSWSERLALLSNVTSNPGVFEPRGKFGFFNQSPLCIQNLFSEDTGGGIKLFKLLYVTLLGITILLFSVSYIWIAVTRFRSPVPTADKAQRATKERKNIKMSKKVALIISSQLLAWIPIIIATILSYCDKNVPQDFYEIAAIILIPVNSLVNPLFHSPNKAFTRKKSNRSTTQQMISLSPSTRQSEMSLSMKSQECFGPEEENIKDAELAEDTKDVIDLSNILLAVDIK